MRTRSSEFDQAIQDGCEVVSEAILFRGTEQLRVLPVVSGSWTEDQTATVRTSANLTLMAEDPSDIVPSSDPLDTSGLWPTGNEIQLRCGVKYRSGESEMLDIGRFRVSRPKATLSIDAGVQVTVECYDRSRAMSRARFVKPYGIIRGLDYATAIGDLVQSRLPSIPRTSYQFMRTDGYGGSPVFKTPGAIFLLDDDPSEMVNKMAKSFGAEFFFNEKGIPVLRPIPTLLDDPCWEYLADEKSLLLEASRELDDELAYNGVVVTGINSSGEEVAKGEYWDTDPSSPTYYDPTYPGRSVYGAVPYFITSEYVRTTSQAVAAAQGNFPQVTGVLESVDFSAVPHFAHQAGDIVEVQVDELGVGGPHILESFTCGISHTETLGATTRRRQL